MRMGMATKSTSPSRQNPNKPALQKFTMSSYVCSVAIDLCQSSFSGLWYPRAHGVALTSASTRRNSGLA